MAQDRPTLKDRFYDYVPRFVTNRVLANHMSQDTQRDASIPSAQASWTKALMAKSGEKMPQVIAHRGYRAKYPENTMLAFDKALTAGAQALETDIHLTKDNIAVLTHDPSLKRCWGSDKYVADCDWSYIQNLRTIEAPHVPMPRLIDLLEYLAEPGREDIWLLLDIKMDDDPDVIIKAISEAITAVAPSSTVPWEKRIVLGIWAIKYLSPCAKYLPDFALSNIGFSTIYARSFMKPQTPNVTFNMIYPVLMMPISGPRFIRNAHRENRAVYAWTVNDEGVMKWCMKHGVDGIITDEVEKLVDVQAAWQRGDRRIKIKPGLWVWAVFVWILSSVLAITIRRRLNAKGGRISIQK